MRKLTSKSFTAAVILENLFRFREGLTGFALVYVQITMARLSSRKGMLR
jgi:hypothetical protein